MGAYRLQAQLKVRDSAVAHPWSDKCEDRYSHALLLLAGLEVGSHHSGCAGPVLSCHGPGEMDWKVQHMEMGG